MTTAGQPARKVKSIVRFILRRALAYGILGLIVIFAVVDFHSLPLHGGAPLNSLEENDGSNPGWPQLRGPGYDGHSGETELADSWPAKGPPILWVREIGAGYSGLIGHGGIVYTQDQGLTGQQVLALAADSGQTIWEYNYSWPYQAGGMFPGPRATPTWSSGRIYFAAPNGLVGCLNAADGRLIWSVNVVQRFNGQGAGFGYACSPVVEEGRVILPVGGPAASVVALDANSGATVWASGSAPASYSSALPITFHGRQQVAVFLQNTLAGFDLQSGQQLWEQAYARGFEEHAAALLYREPYVRAMQAYRAGSDLYTLEPTGEIKSGVPGVGIKRLRHDAQVSNDVASSVLVDGYVYGFDLRDMQANGSRPSRGTFRCMDFKTGDVRWSSDKPGQAAMVVADGKLLMLNDSGQALLVRASPDRYEELGRADVFPGETCWTAPALYHGRLYLRSPARAACLFVGKPQAMTPRQRALAAAPVSIAKAPTADLTWLVGAQREYPFELPDIGELMPWYLFSLAAFAAAAGLGAIASAVGRWHGGQASPRTASVFFAGLILFGIITTPLANRHWHTFVFTWPLALIAIHQLSLAAVAHSKASQQNSASDWQGISGAGLLVLTCIVYFKLTRQLSLAPAWYFLGVLPLTWPLALPAARRLLRPGKFARDVLWMFAVFSLYFWSAGAVMIVRTTIFSNALNY